MYDEDKAEVVVALIDAEVNKLTQYAADHNFTTEFFPYMMYAINDRVAKLNRVKEWVERCGSGFVG